MFRFAFILILLAFAAASAAQAPMAGAGSPVTDAARGESHGWVVSPAAGIHDWAVLHLPPRLDPGGETGASDGAVRQGVVLPNMPVALAAWDNRIHMVFAPQEVEPDRFQRPVLGTGSVRGAVPGQWVTETEGRRLPASPSLPGDGDLVGFTGTPHGPAALIDDGADGARSFRLLLLTGSAWRQVPLPDDFNERAQVAPASARVGLVGHTTGPGLFLVTAQGGRIWTGDFRIAEEIEVDWQSQSLRLVAGDGQPAPLPDSSLFYISGHYAYAARPTESDIVEVWSLSPGTGPDDLSAGAWRLTEISGITEEWAVAPLHASGRVAIVWAERVLGRGSRPRGMARSPEESEPENEEEETPRTQEVRRFVAEISLYTGAVLYEGPAIIRGPVSPQELRLLALAVVALMAVIVIFILRPEPRGPPLILPPGYALAEPGRRIASAAVDLVAAAFITSLFLDVRLWELLTLRGVLTPGGIGLGAVFGVLFIGYIMTTLGEWIAGRSLGKFITGCEVVRPIIERTAEGQIVPSVQPIGLWRAAVRNIVKWTIPPVAMAGLGTSERRHRGDLAAGTAVVIRIEEPEPA